MITKTVLILAVLASLIGVHFSMPAGARRDAAIAVETPPLLFRVPRPWRPMMAFGHDQALDQLHWLWLVQMMEAAPPESAARVSENIKFFAAQKPRIKSVYILGCVVLHFKLGRSEDCRDVTQHGLEVFADDWHIPSLQGYIEAFALKQRPRGALFYALAASKPDAPPYIKNTAAKLRDEEPLDEQAQSDVVSSLYNLPGARAIIDDFVRQKMSK